MTLAPARPPELIDTPGALTTAADFLHRHRSIAVDTESNSMHAYQEQVCLMQFTAGGRDLLVDPLALDSLEPLRDLFEDPATEVIFHAAEYDLIGLYRDFGWRIAGLFDTMIAARTLGWHKVGLANMLNHYYGVRLDKRYQRANWGERPLSDEMMAYARLDTFYLHDLRDRLRTSLAEQGALEEASEEFDRIAANAVRLAEHQLALADRDDNFWRINHAYDLDRRGAARLRALYDYREQQASQRNYPVFKILRDATLLDIARDNPRSLDELNEIESISAGQVRRFGKDILRALKHAASASPPKRPPYRRPDQDWLERVDALKTWRKQRARKRDVETDVILAREVLEELATVNPRDPDELAQVSGLGPWRRAQYADEILSVLKQVGNHNGHQR